AQFIEDKNIVMTAVVGISSQDSHVIDNAIEALHGLNNRNLAKMLIEILERYHGAKAASNSVLLTSDKIQALCNKENDPWLSTCLNKYLSLTNNTKISYA
ncbi:MAG: hypothetical protein OEX19_04785, partial [Gammaproteobacteria bacterium]|nr:hypothetical protein [Gammaproteobacteria bacterium]